jgi:hypothetical protein
MISSRIMRALIVILADVALLVTGCGSNPAAPPADMAAGSFVTSDCGSCVETACSQQISTCAGDPGCAAYYGCVRACPTGARGDVDATCEAGCPMPSGAGAAAAQAVRDCRNRGQGALCAACGHLPSDDAGSSNPLLNQQCPASTETKMCFICEDDHCCNGETDCNADADCLAVKACLKACVNAPPDDGGGDGYNKCVYDCERNAPRAGLTHYLALFTCVQVLCLHPCGDPSVSACVDCQVNSCRDSLVACRTNADCALIFDCSAACPSGNVACIDACVSQYPAGEQLFNDYTVCGTGRCQVDCG